MIPVPVSAPPRPRVMLRRAPLMAIALFSMACGAWLGLIVLNIGRALLASPARASSR